MARPRGSGAHHPYRLAPRRNTSVAHRVGPQALRNPSSWALVSSRLRPSCRASIWRQWFNHSCILPSHSRTHALRVRGYGGQSGHLRQKSRHWPRAGRAAGPPLFHAVRSGGGFSHSNLPWSDRSGRHRAPYAACSPRNNLPGFSPVHAPGIRMNRAHSLQTIGHRSGRKLRANLG